jgi:hypothetical protein
MTSNDFRRIATSLPEAVESSHMDHPDFRVRGKIFATLFPDGHWGVVKLTPEQQTILIRAEPEVFVPVKGGWGRRGYTQVRLEIVEEPALQNAMATAWRNAAPKCLTDC